MKVVSWILLAPFFISFLSTAQPASILTATDSLVTEINAFATDFVYTSDGKVEVATIDLVLVHGEPSSHLVDKLIELDIPFGKIIDGRVESPGRKPARQWDLDQEGSVFRYAAILKDLPGKIEFLVDTYEASASVKQVGDQVIVGNIRWGGMMFGVSANTTLEESIFTKSGKLKPHWEKRTKGEIEAAIVKELRFYE